MTTAAGVRSTFQKDFGTWTENRIARRDYHNKARTHATEQSTTKEAIDCSTRPSAAGLDPFFANRGGKEGGRAGTDDQHSRKA